jgi:hypothetical protein
MDAMARHRSLLPLAGALLALATFASAASAAETQLIPMTADRWTLSEGVQIVEHLGVPAIAIPRAQPLPEAVLKDVVFTDGTIELDVDGGAGLGPAVGFRRRGSESAELFYVRPKPTCPTDDDCVQYAPIVKGVLLWDLYPALQRPARFVPNQWNHLKLVVSGRRLRVWVNGGEPALDVTLEGDPAPGGIFLRGTGFSANLRITPGAVEGLPRDAAADPSVKDARLVRGWSISPVVKLPEGAEPDFAARPATASAWAPMPAETGGLVNISRRYGQPEGRSLVWLRTTIRSPTKAEKRAAIGWNDEVWVFVNGKPVYADKNLYLPPEGRKKPDGRLSLENGAFALPLEAGDNDVVIGVANAFFGWGLMLRLDDVAGVTLAAPTR